MRGWHCGPDLRYKVGKGKHDQVRGSISLGWKLLILIPLAVAVVPAA
jgi:hypothetical protein